MLVYILIRVAVFVAVLAIVVSFRPSALHIERSITVAAPAELLFAQVDDLHAWARWSPWDKKDRQMTKTFSGPPTGVGASYMWSGNRKVGQGQMTIEQSNIPTRIAIRLEFKKPFTATNTSTFTFARLDEGTQVTWAMDGRNNFFAKAFGLIMDMDKMVGRDFEVGLTSLKAIAERVMASPPPALS